MKELQKTRNTNRSLNRIWTSQPKHRKLKQILKKINFSNNKIYTGSDYYAKDTTQIQGM
jgi:hypothetical protein